MTTANSASGTRTKSHSSQVTRPSWAKSTPGNLRLLVRVGDFATHRRDWSVMKDAVLKTIEVIRPALQADGGDMILRSIDEETGRIEVELIGACGTCPASTVTMKAGIERILKDRVEGVTEVVAV